MSKKILIIMDPIESINIEKDTTYQLMQSAQNIGYELYYLIPGTMAIRSLEPVGVASKIKLTKNKTTFYNLSDNIDCILSDFDYILMRKDPPVDNNYIYKTYILDLIKNSSTKVINTGFSLRNHNEKLIILNFPEHIPDTIVTSNKKNLESFKKKHKKIILKPLNLMGGRSIYFIENTEKNLNVIGLMVIPPNNKNSKKYFQSLNELNTSLALSELSMGMSSDYMDAVSSGATYVRIGSSIFGSRD